jgi:ABC-type taurine transport system substrate-binding protein
MIISEIDRLCGICQRLEAWGKDPTLSVAAVARLTGISRTRVEQLIEKGSFQHGHQTENREVLLGTVLNHFLCRVSKLSKAGKCPRKGLPKV